MRKKVLAVVTAAVLALGCFTSVSAATSFSPSAYKDVTALNAAAVAGLADNVQPKAGLIAIKEGNALVNGKKANAAQKKAAKYIYEGKIFSTGNMSLDYEQNTDDYTLTAVNWSVAEAFTNLTHLSAQVGTEKVIRVFNITADDADASNPVTVTIADSDVKASKKYALRHFKDGIWDNTSAKVTSVVAGVVKATVTKASPFALVELTGSAAATEETKTEATKGATTTKTAPKTGEV